MFFPALTFGALGAASLTKEAVMSFEKRMALRGNISAGEMWDEIIERRRLRYILVTVLLESGVNRDPRPCAFFSLSTQLELMSKVISTVEDYKRSTKGVPMSPLCRLALSLREVGMGYGNEVDMERAHRISGFVEYTRKSEISEGSLQLKAYRELMEAVEQADMVSDEGGI